MAIRATTSAGALLLLAAGLCACASETDSSQVSDVTVRTEDELQWAQYVANVAMAESYVPTCWHDPASSVPRVLVTGFGRFLDNVENATGRTVAALVPGLEYPLTAKPPAGRIDDPAAQLRVAQATLELPGVGTVEACGMVLPVFWDLAALLVLMEAQSFAPDFVLMNGIAGYRQPIWLELGSTNAAMALPDGSGILLPVEDGAPLLEGLPASDQARGLLLSWTAVRSAAEGRVAELANQTDPSGVGFGSLVQGVRYAGYPRESNTYLCNNTTFVVSYLLDHPGQSFRLLEPSKPRAGGPTGVDFMLTTDLQASPRVFVHWPSALAGEHLARAASVMGSIIGSQLGAAVEPTRGDPAMADLDD